MRVVDLVDVITNSDGAHADGCQKQIRRVAVLGPFPQLFFGKSLFSVRRLPFPCRVEFRAKMMLSDPFHAFTLPCAPMIVVFYKIRRRNRDEPNHDLERDEFPVGASEDRRAARRRGRVCLT